MEMSLPTAILAFLANTAVFIVLAGVLTRAFTGTPVAESYALIGLRFEAGWKRELLMGAGIGVLIPFIQLAVIAGTALVVSWAGGGDVSTVVRDYYASIAESPIGRAGVPAKLLVALVMVAAVGVGEELFFRGMVQTLLGRKVGKGAALILTALVFTAMHGFYLLPGAAALASAMALFTVALIFGYLRQRSDRLFTSIAAHGIGNAIVYTVGANLVYSSL